MTPRWSVCKAGYPYGWEDPLIETDDAQAAVDVYEAIPRPFPRFTTAALFDAHGDGEPLGPDAVLERAGLQ